jgi:hypothetical protein
MTLLEVTDLRTRYGAIEALKGISLTVAEGEVVTPDRLQRGREDDHPALDIGPHPGQ